MSRPALFYSTSKDSPSLLNISFASDPRAGLGAQLVNCDKSAEADSNQFCPGYATVGRVLPGDTVARRAGLAVGDIIVAVNGKGFRRFAADYKASEVEDLTKMDAYGDSGVDDLELDHRVVSCGGAYNAMLTSINSIKATKGDPPLILSLERYTWDAKPNSWRRFLEARDGNVMDAMKMAQEHELWRSKTFPIDLTTDGIQRILKTKAISEIDIESKLEDFPPTVYVNYGALTKLQTAGLITSDDVVNAFVVFTERMLKRSPDPRHPQTCQFIDLTDVSVTSGFRVESLKKIYKVFEPNYPETLFKMVMYPVSTMLGTTARTLLSFVNERTQEKFLITNSLEQVCTELGWTKAEVDECGGIQEFMEKHEKKSTVVLFND